MTRRIVATSLVLALLPSCIFAQVDWFRRYKDRSDLTVTGSKTFAYRSHHITGNKEMFDDDNYGIADRSLDETNLTITGKVYGGLNVNASFTDNRWNPSQRVMTLGYQGRTTKFDIGDINASLQGNYLVPFNRRLKGIMLTQKVGKSNITGIVSQTRAATRTVNTTGNNTSGPYYLGATQIIDGSERIKIDEREIPRTDGNGVSNYTLDSYSGILQFRDGLTVPQSSQISVSFESQGYNNVAGTLWGIRSSVPVGDKLNMGFTYLTQASGKQSTPKLIDDRFRGEYGPDAPCFLRYVPQPGIVVKIDGILQIPDEIGPDGKVVRLHDYFINYPLHYILFHRPIPGTSVIVASYFPRQDESVSGDKSVMGFDSSLKLSENLLMEGQFARSSVGGNALNMKTNGKFGDFTLGVGLRNIASNFSSVDSIGFLRREKGGNLNFEYRPNERFSFHTGYDRFSRPGIEYNSYSTGVDVPYVDFSNLSTGFTVQLPKWPTLTLSRSKLTNSGGLDTSRVSNSLSTDALDLRWSAPSGKITIGAGLSRNNNQDDVYPEYSNISNTSRLNFQYLPGEKLSMGFDISGSKITEATGNTYNANNTQLTANYMPTSALSFSANYRISDSGRIAPFGNSGYNNYGGGYAGYQNQIYLTSYGGKSITRMLGTRYAPTDKFSIDANINSSMSEGDSMTNTSSLGKDLGLTLMPWKWMQFMGHISLQDMDYVGSTGSMGSKLGFFRLQLGPLKDFTLDLNYQRMISSTIGSGSTGSIEVPDYDYNLNSLTAELRRPIGHGRTAFLQYQSSDTTGYETVTKAVTALGVDFPVTNIFAVTLDWRITNYNDWKTTTNDYRANSLNVQFGARFR